MVEGGAVLNNSPPPPENKGRGGLRTHFAIYKLNILKNGGHIQASPTTLHYQYLFIYSLHAIIHDLLKTKYVNLTTSV